jgi:2-polyprenyl-3-methyl-5-hydroxy-6-metoxy-1,4-benzoquinol methylase
MMTGLVTLGPSASDQWLRAPEHLAMVLARYRAASALIGSTGDVLEVGCGEGIGARILGRGRSYLGVDPDAAAISSAHVNAAPFGMRFELSTVESLALRAPFEAVVALDVIEHIAEACEPAFMAAIVRALVDNGVCVIGTPSARFGHLASPQSRAAHVNIYTHDRLYALMGERFRVVQSFGMQDTALHLGHPDARHYLLMCGIGLR